MYSYSMIWRKYRHKKFRPLELSILLYIKSINYRTILIEWEKLLPIPLIDLPLLLSWNIMLRKKWRRCCKLRRWLRIWPRRLRVLLEIQVIYFNWLLPTWRILRRWQSVFSIQQKMLKKILMRLIATWLRQLISLQKLKSNHTKQPY